MEPTSPGAVLTVHVEPTLVLTGRPRYISGIHKAGRVRALGDAHPLDVYPPPSPSPGGELRMEGAYKFIFSWSGDRASHTQLGRR